MSTTPRVVATFVLGLGLGLAGGWTAHEALSTAPAPKPVEVADAPAEPPNAEEDKPEPGPRVKAGKLKTAEPGPLPPGRHPNVLFLMWDTVRADRLSALGHDRPTTPWLERLAEQSVVFERAISPSYWTVPSHASLFTGLPVSAHGTHTENTWLAGSNHTLAEHFRTHGYDTWAFSSNPNLTPSTNLVQGFNTLHLSSDEPWREAATAWNRDKVPLTDSSTDRSPAWAMNVPRHYKNVHKDAAPVATTALMEWLDQRPDDRPWFAYINYMEAHYPRLPSLESREAVLSPKLLDAGLSTVAGMKRLIEATRGQNYFSADEREAILGVYDAAIRDLDNACANLYATLADRGMLEDTLIVVVADHGEAFGEHGIYGHNFTVHTEVTHVPLFVYYPPKLTPAKVPHAVSTADLYLTLSELAELPPPNAPIPLRSVLDSTQETLVFSELRYYHGWKEDVPLRRPDGSWYPNRRRYQAIAQGNHRAIRASDDSLQLFDLSRDPGELKDLYGNNPALAQKLLKAYHGWRRALPKPGSLANEELRERKAAQQDSELTAELRALGYVQ